MQVKNDYNEVTFRQYDVRRTFFKSNADIVLKSKKDPCDFLALGIFLLAKSIDKKDETNCEGEIIKICYKEADFEGSSGCSLIHETGMIPVPRMPLQRVLMDCGKKIIEHLYGFRLFMSEVISISIAPEFYGIANGYYDVPEIRDMIPGKISMRNAEMAQRFAYNYFCNKLDVLYPYPIEMIREEAKKWEESEAEETASEDQK